MTIKDLEQDDFYERLKKKHGVIPLDGQLDITYDCSLDCVHCYCKGMKVKILSAGKWKMILDEISELGGRSVALSGGDPTLHPGFKEIYAHALMLGFRVKIFTNGFDISDDIVDFLGQNPPECVEVTVHSLKKEVFENVTRHPGSFERVMENIHRLKSAGVPLLIKTVGLKENKYDIYDVKSFSVKLLGKDRFKLDTYVFPKLDGDRSPLAHRLDPDDVFEIENNDPQMRRERLRRLCRQNTNPGDARYRCETWRRSYSISPEGVLRWCYFTTKHCTDLKTHTLKEGLDRFNNIPLEKVESDSECRRCEFLHVCSICPSRALIEVGVEEEVPVEYFCKKARNLLRHRLPKDDKDRE